MSRLIGLLSRVFATGQRDQALIPGRVIPKTLASMSTHTKRNICAIIKQATSPHFTEPL